MLVARSRSQSRTTARTTKSPRVPRTRKEIPPAETGRPETAREFSKRINHVILRVGSEGREGANPPEQAAETSAAPGDNAPTDNVPESGDDEIPPPAVTFGAQFFENLSESSEGMDLLAALKGHYREDPFFAKILSNLRTFVNTKG